MYKLLLSLLLVLFLTLFPASPMGAAEEGGGEVVTGGDVENSAPVIDEGSIIVQIVDGEGIAWGWSADGSPNPGDRALPYILKGEQLHIELEVSDSNGEPDFAAMQVNMNLLPGYSFTGTLVSTTIDPDAGISKGLYSGDLVVDESIPAGKYDITIDIADPAGATDDCDPAIYEEGVDILKPDVSLVISSSSVIFPPCDPGDLGIVANENPIQLTPQAVIDTEHIPVVFSLSHSGTDMDSEGNILPVDAIVWSMTSEIADNSLSGDFQTITSDVAEGTVIDVYYWLNVPNPQAVGTYSGAIDFHYIAD
jgi:hypothetical protein